MALVSVTSMNDKKNYFVADFDEIKGTPCPCGQSKRAFVQDGNGVASMHVVEISKESRPHYHKKMTEVYFGQLPFHAIRITTNSVQGD